MAMEESYSLAISVNELKKDERLQDIINQILRQTIECGYFIQEYTRRNFGGMWQPSLAEVNNTTKYLSERTIAQPFAGVDDRITAFCAAFTVLRKTFDSKLTVNTALVHSRAVTTVEAISEHLVH